jgi:hypothetical protein
MIMHQHSENKNGTTRKRIRDKKRRKEGKPERTPEETTKLQRN